MIFLALATLLLALVGLTTFLVSTESGLQMVWNRLEPALPAGLEIGSVDGRLIGPLAMGDLEFEDGQLRITASRLRLEWSPADLLRGVFHVDRLILEGVAVTSLAPDSAQSGRAPWTPPERIELPLTVVVDAVRLTDLSYHETPRKMSLAIDDLNAAGSFSGGRLRLEHLTIASSLFDLEGSADITARGDYPLRAAGRWQARPGHYPPVLGSTRLSGTLKKLVIDQTIAAPYGLEATISASEIFDDLHLDGTIGLTGLALQRINPAAPDLILDGTLNAQGKPEDLTVSASGQIRQGLTGSLEIDFEGRYRADAFLLESLHAVMPDQTARLQASGRIGLADQRPELDVDISWEDLRWPLTGEAVITSHRGVLSVAGRIDDYELAGDLEIESPRYTAASLGFNGRGNQQSLELSRLSLMALDGAITGSGDLGWEPGLRARLDLSGRGLNPVALLPGWQGRLDVEARAEARLETDRVSIGIRTIEASGTLRDFPLRLSASADYDADQIYIRSFLLDSGPSRIDLRGSVGELFDLDWKMDSPDLSSLLPDAMGSISASGHAGGSRDKPHITARVEGSGLRFREDSLASIAVDADVDMAGSVVSSIAVELDGAMVADVGIDALSLNAGGTPGDHQITLKADTERGTADLDVSGALEQTGWAYRLTRGTLEYAGLEALILQGPASGRIDRHHLALSETCWGTGPATFCATADWTPEIFTGQFTLDALPAAYFASFLPADLRFDTTLSGQGRLSREADLITDASIRLANTPGFVSTHPKGEPPLRLLEFAAGEFRLDVNEQGLQLSASLPLPDQGLLALQAGVQPGPAPLTARPLQGQLTSQLRDVSVLSEMIPELSRIEGNLGGTVLLSGTLAQPAVNGRITLTDATATLDRPGLVLDELIIDLAGEGSGAIAINLSARSGGGTLMVKGLTDLTADPVRTDLNITGDNVQVLNIPEARLFASPDLDLIMTGRSLEISGKIQIPRGAIEPRQLPQTAVRISGDQVIVDDSHNSAPASAYAIKTRVRVIINEQLKFDGFGLKGRFQGNLLIIDSPDKPTTASGELRIIDGVYRAYGQNLDIRTGRLLFAGGPVTDPAVDVEAVRRPAADVLVGIKVRGNLREPEFSLFSDPAMSESEQLSYLVLGRSMERDATTEESSALNQAALGLGLASSALLGEDLGERLGVDELTVESGPGETSEQASLLVGKYLSPKLYVSYGLGLFEPVSTFRLRYTLTSKWRLVGETSATESGADFFYVIERGR